MATITIPFTNAINTSLQIGDKVYYCTPTSSGKGSITTNTLSDIVELGDCSAISSNSIQVENVPSDIDAPVEGDFVLFGKDKKVNLSSVKGYYAEVEFRNNSTEEAEVFSIGIDVVESSK